MPKIIDYTQVLDDIHSRIKNAETCKRDLRLKVTPRLDKFIMQNTTEALTGDVVIAQLYTALDNCGMQRTATQRMFHKQFVHASLPHVYGKAVFGKFKDRILTSHGIQGSDYNQYTLISTPRRWGKTTSVAMFVACMLFCVPDAWISVFSTGRRASKSLADMTHKFLCALEAGKTSGVLVKNTEELFYKGAASTDVRRLFSYPATVQVSK